MNRYRVVLRTLALAGTIAVLAAGCGTDRNNGDGEPGDAGELAAPCAEYNKIVNETWPNRYGEQMGVIGAAAANGDEERVDEAVAAVREVFLTTADDLRDLAGRTSHEELAESLDEAADGLADVAGTVETADDAYAASDLMSTSGFAEAGSQVAALCAG